MIPGYPRDDERLEKVARLLTQDAPRLRLDADRFEDRLMREIRARAAAPGRESAGERAARPDSIAPIFSWLSIRPVSLAAALSIMIVSVAASLMLIGTTVDPAGGGSTQAALTESRDDSFEDLLSSPREIPFTVETDLVGARRGTIPLTTYVLEPPPEEATVVRASL